MLGTIGRLSSDGVIQLQLRLKSFYRSINYLQKVSRESLTRGGSQEDPVQLLRDLQDSMEREADLREQLKFAEEEVSISSIVLFSNIILHQNLK